jgi:hypothetical protein
MRRAGWPAAVLSLLVAHPEACASFNQDEAIAEARSSRVRAPILTRCPFPCRRSGGLDRPGSCDPGRRQPGGLGVVRWQVGTALLAYAHQPPSDWNLRWSARVSATEGTQRSMPTLAARIAPIILLACSNVFMTFAWYGHLKFKDRPLWLVILAGCPNSGSNRDRVTFRCNTTAPAALTPCSWNTDLAMSNPTTTTSSTALLLLSAAAKLQRVVESRPRHQQRSSTDLRFSGAGARRRGVCFGVESGRRNGRKADHRIRQKMS